MPSSIPECGLGHQMNVHAKCPCLRLAVGVVEVSGSLGSCVTLWPNHVLRCDLHGSSRCDVGAGESETRPSHPCEAQPPGVAVEPSPGVRVRRSSLTELPFRARTVAATEHCWRVEVSTLVRGCSSPWSSSKARDQVTSLSVGCAVVETASLSLVTMSMMTDCGAMVSDPTRRSLDRSRTHDQAQDKSDRSPPRICGFSPQLQTICFRLLFPSLECDHAEFKVTSEIICKNMFSFCC